jgi:dihydroorotase
MMNLSMHYDMILRNGRVLDPSRAMDRVMDVAIQGDRIAALAPKIPATAGVEYEAGGKYICPGLLDLHGHWYEGSCFGIDPNICLNHGVTTAVDAGTTGFINFPEFRRTAITNARIGVLAFIHIGCIGLPTTIVGELENLEYARPVETAGVIADHRDVALGVKLREGSMTGDRGVAAFELALQACRESGTPLMLHISKGSPTREILPRLRPGDIVTHCFQGRGDGIFDPESGRLLEEVRSAREQGVIFDVGHGSGSFSWDVARRAFEYSFYPDTISTDLHRFSVARYAIDMPTTISKFLHLGMSLADAILKSTCAPAQAIGRPELGTLDPGTVADILVFDIETGEFDLEDTHLRVQKAERRLRPVLVIKGGKSFTPSAYPARLRRLYPCDEDVFRQVEQTK